MKVAVLLLLLPFLSLPIHAQVGALGAELDPAPFRYARALVQSEPGQVSLTLDAAVLAHSHLNDVRLVDAKDRQIPYLREASAEPLVLGLAVPARAQEGELSRYRIRLPYANLPSGKLLIHTPAAVFERRVWLEGSRSRRGRTRWTGSSGLWRRTRSDPSSPLELYLPSGSGETVDLVVDEGDNTPLPLGSIRLQLDTWTIRFLHPGGGGVRLLYGDPHRRAPRYDLTLLSSQLGPEAREVTLLPESPAGSDPARVPRGLFWGALVAAVAVLVLVLVRLMREAG